MAKTYSLTPPPPTSVDFPQPARASTTANRGFVAGRPRDGGHTYIVFWITWAAGLSAVAGNEIFYPVMDKIRNIRAE